ncbi:response regulator [Niabella drilacis]|uniref:Two component transcriptional regulator, LytTR family n=1 Tax=Niabella drilacis (strain DSM 25811 / CCM 8410 / CCUG 62505 / LMG 26954 / E90) TaxID=1285928 RepID=A0A1G6S010_NIADE|nr:response regulator [Niabella drilacis]SDD10158.1 two component transcriptional regulator, LytTR family [Niabella drilacis]
MQATPSSLTYLIIEDSLKVCYGIKERMNDFTNWECSGFAHHVEDAKKMIEARRPLLIFLDWALKGGSAYEVLCHVTNLQQYDPYIIFNTGYQSENPEIPQEIINNYRIDKYLVKPLWENLRLNLPQYLQEAVSKAGSLTKKKATIWLTDIFKNRHHVLLEDMVCVQQDPENSYYKVLYFTNNTGIYVKISWQEISGLLQSHGIHYFITNSKEHIVIKNHIRSYKCPYVRLNCFSQKIEVVKNKLSAFEKWMAEPE